MNLFDKITYSKVEKFIRKGNIDKALVLINQSKSKSYKTFFYRGVCYYEKDNYDAAIDNLNSAYQLNRTYECGRILSEVYMQIGDWDSALAIIKHYEINNEAKYLIEIINSDDKTKQRYLNYASRIRQAIKHLKAKEYEQSISCLEDALSFTNKKIYRAEVYNQMGGIYYNYLKQVTKAEEYFIKASTLNPNEPKYKKNLILFETK